MRIRFRATESFCFADEYAITCGVAGPDADGIERALSFGRVSEAVAADDPEDDWGVHTEFDDQINGAYGCVGRCRLAREALAVDLSGPLGSRLVGVEGFDVDMAIDEEAHAVLRAGLIRVFLALPGLPGLLVLA